jgi:hypothetical protein
MKKTTYIQPITHIVELESEAHIMEASAGDTFTSNGLNDPFSYGGQNDGTHTINSKNHDGIWDFGEED